MEPLFLSLFLDNMKPKISVISLGVTDLPTSIKFYQNLGFELALEENLDSIAFFKLSNQAMLLGLYPREKLAEDAMIPNDGNGFPGFTIAHNVKDEATVDAVLKEAESCGATIIKPGQKVFWGGYSGYFKDLDGFLWEVAFNPYMDLT